MDVEIQHRNTLISFGALSGAGLILAFIRTWKWFSRSGRDIIDLPTIGKFILYIFGIIGTVLLLVTAGVSIYCLIVFKRQYDDSFLTNISALENLLRIFLIVAFILKTIDIIHLIIRQSTIDIFFMDWERPKADNRNSVSVWRTYFAANELNEIQTFRRINVSFQLFLVLLVLKVINLENIACAQIEISVFSTNVCNREYVLIFRTAIGFLTLLGTAIIQYLVYTIFYQRFIEDKIINFIDLCAVSNISVFILDGNYHGYYIHGRSPHGMTDVNMKEILRNLYREENRMSGTRGLQNNSDEQIFIVKINRQFRRKYASLFQNYYNFNGPRKMREDFERYTNILLQSYQDLNIFLCGFIDHSLPSHEYVIRNRFFLEKILNYEFRAPPKSNFEGQIDNLLFVDNEKNFTNIFFYGEESTLFIWNIITFLFIDILARNYVLAAIITYIVNSIFVGIRDSFGRKNLSKKTLIPKNFLI
ncbi:unnamed protein product [Rotaria sordida]|uniref:Meckelin n=1 Tax=Rotaria sordida TaxID=392033 RepID=A0A814KAU9_9BILA|nr:unnamed protein product [Rotaria sordida]CAF1466531.1 unnamed protein product [Rotaria sordida]